MTTPAGGFLGKLAGIGEQMVLWGVLQQAIGAAGQPALTELAALVNADHPLTRLSPADAATAVNRSFLSSGNGATEAAAAGIDAGRFATLRLLAGTAPSPQDLAAALRRGVIGEAGTGGSSTSFEQGIREGNLLNKWAPLVKALAKIWPTPQLALNALLEGQLPQAEARALYEKLGGDPQFFDVEFNTSGSSPTPAEAAEMLRRGVIQQNGTGPDATSYEQAFLEGPWRDKWAHAYLTLAKIWPTPPLALNALLKGQLSEQEASALYGKLGGDPQFFRTEYNVEGNAPSPVEALQLAKRGVIPWTGTGTDTVSYEQAFLEGPWRNKWLKSFEALAEYIPPPETVRTLLEQGAIDHDQAAKWWSDYGLADSTVTAYLNAATFNNTAATRGLTESSVLDMYYAQLISEDDAKKLLDLFGTPASNQGLMLAYVDMRRSITAVNSAVSRIQTLYVARKIGEQTARDALGRLQIPAVTIDSVIQTWNLEASVNVKTLTPAEIADAVKEAIIEPDEGLSELQALGYTPYDAWVYLSTKLKTALPDKPPKISAAPLGAVIPGVT